MNILESLKSTSEDGFDISKKYVDVSYKYSKLKAFQIVTYAVSSLSKLFLIGTLLSAGLIFMSVAGAIALGDYLNNMSLGYLCIGLSLLLIGYVIYLTRKVIDKKIIKTMFPIFFDTKP